MRISDWSSDVCSSDLQAVLHGDGQRQQSIEEGGDRRQVFFQRPTLDGQRQAGGFLEARERAALDTALRQQHIELPQRRARLIAFEIVLGAKQPLPARSEERRVGKACVSPGISRWSPYH